MRWIAALASSLIVVFSVSAAAAPLTPEAAPFAGSPEVPGGPPPALADGDGLSDDFQVKAGQVPARCRHELRRAVFSLLPEESTLTKAVRFLLGPASLGEIGRDQPCSL